MSERGNQQEASRLYFLPSPRRPNHGDIKMMSDIKKMPLTADELISTYSYRDRLCDLVVRILGYRSGGQASIPGTTRKKSNGSGTGSTQPREYN
jgi:hypothetical protein